MATSGEWPSFMNSWFHTVTLVSFLKLRTWAMRCLHVSMKYVPFVRLVTALGSKKLHETSLNYFGRALVGLLYGFAKLVVVCRSAGLVFVISLFPVSSPQIVNLPCARIRRLDASKLRGQKKKTQFAGAEKPHHSHEFQQRCALVPAQKWKVHDKY